jgi:hypothetical protein
MVAENAYRRPEHSEAYYMALDLQREEQLFKAIESSYKSLAPFRELNRNLVKDYTGHNYGGASATGRPKKYINKMFQAINGHMMLLAANRPQVMVQTEFMQLRAFGRLYQTALNNLLAEIEVETTIRDWVLSTFFGGLGVIKVHLKDSGMVRYEGDVAADPGCPFASNVYLDDWVHDMGVKRYSQTKYASDMYRITWSQFEQGLEDGLYEAEYAEGLTPNTKFTDTDQDRVDQYSRGYISDLDELEPMIDLADVWLPKERVIKTYAVESRRDFRLKGRALSIMEWDGIEMGPYHLLGFADVPENIMPSSIAAHWEALDEFINISFRKKSRQTNRMKENLCANSAGTDTAHRLKKANDGEVLTNVNLESVRTFRQGGSDPNLDVTIQNSLGLFSQVANNLDSILGAGPQAETLGQEELIRSAGNRIASQMQYRVIEGTTKVISNLGCLLWKDQFKKITASIDLGNGIEPQQDHWEPGDREGNFQQYNFKLNMYSMMYRSPAQQSQTVTQLLMQVYLPALQLMQQQGISIDFAALTSMFSELLYLPELKSVIVSQGIPNTDQSSPSSEVMGKSPVTSRNYTRRSVPSGQPSGQELVYQQPSLNGANGSGHGGSGWSGNNNGWM